jgi:predicted transcriptional regulator
VGRTIVYTATVVKDRLRRTLVREFLARVFPHGDRRPLFNALIRDAELSPEEVQYLRDLLNEHVK